MFSGLPDQTEEISVAPQAVLCPSKATGVPLIVQEGSPSTMGYVPSHLGQATMSPMQAMGLPMSVGGWDTEITLPPWLVTSPRRITPRASFFSDIVYSCWNVPSFFISDDRNTHEKNLSADIRRHLGKFASK